MADNGKKDIQGLVIKLLMTVIGLFLSVMVTLDFAGTKALQADVKKIQEDVNILMSKRELYEERFQNIGADIQELKKGSP